MQYEVWIASHLSEKRYKTINVLFESLRQNLPNVTIYLSVSYKDPIILFPEKDLVVYEHKEKRKQFEHLEHIYNLSKLRDMKNTYVIFMDDDDAILECSERYKLGLPCLPVQLQIKEGLLTSSNYLDLKEEIEKISLYRCDFGISGCGAKYDLVKDYFEEHRHPSTIEDIYFTNYLEDKGACTDKGLRKQDFYQQYDLRKQSKILYRSGSEATRDWCKDFYEEISKTKATLL